jgi:hypothetical protein
VTRFSTSQGQEQKWRRSSCTLERVTRLPVVLTLVALFVSGCASLGNLSTLIQPPRFEEAPDHQAEVRLLSPSLDRPLGGAGVRLWARVTNPNPFGFTLATLRGTLVLQEARAASVDFPLGLPLGAGGNADVPIDIAFGFSELPELATVLRRAVGREPIPYRLEGTIGVEAGRLGTPVFGPMTLLTGTVR